ncbi:hypothetical protein [Paraburkholderia sp. SIMBA_054]|uniref:hypothetical protein n=1 Tax=Paraburkholderia sp. SIMBA_054 TaxID=3085795 RepID=UPI003977EC68
MNYDAAGHAMQCGVDGTWVYIPEGDADRITRKLDQLNETDTKILLTLQTLLATRMSSNQSAEAQMRERSESRRPLTAQELRELPSN